MKCAAHPAVETNLKCSKCGKPICPKCLVQTPVGARCRNCARLYKSPTYNVSKLYYLRAAGTAAGAGVVCGILWFFLEYFLFFYLGLLLAAGIGYAISELVSRAVNRKRGNGLATIAALGVITSYLVTILVGGIPLGLLGIAFDLLALALGIYIAVSRLR